MIKATFDMTTTFTPSIGDLGNFLSPDAFDVLAAEFDGLGRPGLPSDFPQQLADAQSNPETDADERGLDWLHAFHLWAWPTLARRFHEAHQGQRRGIQIFTPAY